MGPVIAMNTEREVAERCSGLLLYTPEAYNCTVYLVQQSLLVLQRTSYSLKLKCID